LEERARHASVNEAQQESGKDLSKSKQIQHGKLQN